jgi:hypothetical protein
MKDDSNVIDFGARAAVEREMRVGRPLTELDGAALKTIFDAAFIDARLDEDGDCVVRDDVTLITMVDPDKDLFKVYAFFPTSGTREQALEFCNRFNLHLVVVRAQVRDTADSERKWVVIFDYDRLVFEEERIEAGTIVKMVRRFEAIVRNGIARLDEDKIF